MRERERENFSYLFSSASANFYNDDDVKLLPSFLLALKESRTPFVEEASGSNRADDRQTNASDQRAKSSREERREEARPEDNYPQYSQRNTFI